MKAEAWLIVKRSGALEIRKRRPDHLGADERGVHLRIDMDDRLWSTPPLPTVNLTVAADYQVLEPDAATVVTLPAFGGDVESPE